MALKPKLTSSTQQLTKLKHGLNMGKRKDPMKVFNEVVRKHDQVFRELNSGSKKSRNSHFYCSQLLMLSPSFAPFQPFPQLLHQLFLRYVWILRFDTFRTHTHHRLSHIHRHIHLHFRRQPPNPLITLLTRLHAQTTHSKTVIIHVTP